MPAVHANDPAARREAWARDLTESRLDDIAAAFVAGHTEPPLVTWNPALAEFRTEQIRFVMEHWNGLRGADPVPPIARLDPTALRPALGYIMLVDPVDDGADFRYRLYGSLIASVSGIDLTGRLVSQHHASPYVVDFSFAGYLAVLRRREPLYTFRRPARADFTRSWERLVLPLVDEAGRVGRFLVANVPEGAAGETLRPAY